MLAPVGAANAAGACLAAPNAPAPQGSRWYYRTERPSQRKCWRLVGKDGKEQRAAARIAPEAEPDDETGSIAPDANTPAAPAAEPQVNPAPTPVITTLVTRNVSKTDEFSPPSPSAEAMPRTQVASAAPQTQTADDSQAPAAAVEPAVAPPVATTANAANADSPQAPTLTLLLIAAGLMVLFVGAVALVMGLMRRRTDVLNVIRDRERLPFARSPEMSPEPDAPSFAPLPPMIRMARTDDVEDAVQNYARRQRRRAISQDA